MKRMLSVLIIAVLMVTGILAGCSQESAVEGDASTKTGDSKEDSADVEVKESDVDEKVTITFQTWNPSEGDMIHEIIGVFEEQNPNIDIDYIFMPYNDHMQDMKINLAAGEGADVYGLNAGVQYQSFRDFEEDLTPYANESWGEGWQSQYVDFCMDLLEDNGQYFGLPLGLTYSGFIWADVNFLNNYDLEVPKSYSELEEAAAVLRANNEYPFAIGAKDDWINIDTWMSIGNDVSSEKLYAALEGEISFTDPALVESFEIWQSLFTKGLIQDGAVGVSQYSDVTDLFRLEGSIPLLGNGSWQAGDFKTPDETVNEIFNGDGANHEVFLMDWNDDGKPSPVSASIDVVLCMNANSEKKEAAWKFIDFMLHQGQDILINKYMQYSPARADLILDVEGLSENGSVCLDYIVEQSSSNFGGYREIPYVDVKQSISDVLKELAIEMITPEEAAAKVEAVSKTQAR